METNPPGPIARAVENASAVVRAILPGRAVLPPHRGAGDVAVAGLALLAAMAFVEVVLSGGQFSYWSYRQAAGELAMHVAVLFAVVLLAGHSPRLAGFAAGVFWALTMGQGLAVIGALCTETYSLGGWLIGYALPAYLPLILFVLASLGPVTGLAGALAFLASVAFVASEWVMADDPLPPLLPDTEAVYREQAGLLDAQVSALRPSVPGLPETFAVVGGGDPDEPVFAREVAAVAARLEADYGAQRRTIRLLNSTQSPTGLPLLNRSNFVAALDALAAVMDPEDVAVVFLTSHGAPGLLATQFAGVSTRDLEAADVAQALDASGIRNVVAVVSACYSGSFLGALGAPDRLIVTASREDRTSFGCGADAEWTYFGKAFWVDALDLTRDPREAARIAADLVRTREAEQGFPPSEPQIVEGADIGPVLDRWLEALPAPR